MCGSCCCILASLFHYKLLMPSINIGRQLLMVANMTWHSCPTEVDFGVQTNNLWVCLTARMFLSLFELSPLSPSQHCFSYVSLFVRTIPWLNQHSASGES